MHSPTAAEALPSARQSFSVNPAPEGSTLSQKSNCNPSISFAIKTEGYGVPRFKVGTVTSSPFREVGYEPGKK